MPAAEPPRRPAPIITDDSAIFWDAASEGRLVAQECASCGALRHPPRPMCGHCQSTEIEVVALSGRGSLYSYAILHHPRHPAFEYPLLAALVRITSYNVCYTKLLRSPISAASPAEGLPRTLGGSA